MAAARLEALMRKDVSVVPPDSIIKTFSHLKAEDVDLVLTQDGAGISSGSVVLRNGEWARFFLETWFDPLYRSYNFQRAETHALVGWRLSFFTHGVLCLGGLLTLSVCLCRNTLCSGTRPSSRAWPSSTSECSIPTPRGPRTRSTRTATLSSGFPTARRPRRPGRSVRARSSLWLLRRPGGGCLRPPCEGVLIREALEYFDQGVGGAFGHGFRHT